MAFWTYNYNKYISKIYLPNFIFIFQSFQSVFHSLILVDIKDTNNLQNISSLYIEALSFLSDLVAKNPKWMSLYSEVLNQKQVYSVLAYIIYNGPKKMKRKVLDLITKFSQQRYNNL